MSQWRAYVRRYNGDMRAASQAYRSAAASVGQLPASYHINQYQGDWLHETLLKLSPGKRIVIKKKSSKKEVASIDKAEGAYHIRLAGDSKLWKSFKMDQANAMYDAMQDLCGHLKLSTEDVDLSLAQTSPSSPQRDSSPPHSRKRSRTARK